TARPPSRGTRRTMGSRPLGVAGGRASRSGGASPRSAGAQARSASANAVSVRTRGKVGPRREPYKSRRARPSEAVAAEHPGPVAAPGALGQRNRVVKAQDGEAEEVDPHPGAPAGEEGPALRR